LLKNSNFRGDHNSEDRWQPRWKFPWGLSGATDLFAYDPLLALAVARTRGDSAFRAEVGFSLHLNFRLFQQYRRKAAIAGRENGRRKLGGERVFRESDSTFIGDWNIPLGVVVLSQLWDERRRATTLMSPQGFSRELVTSATTGCVQTD
jgi:hypothetical protein